jgi:hypothetical protein
MQIYRQSIDLLGSWVDFHKNQMISLQFFGKQYVAQTLELWQ